MYRAFASFLALFLLGCGSQKGDEDNLPYVKSVTLLPGKDVDTPRSVTSKINKKQKKISIESADKTPIGEGILSDETGETYRFYIKEDTLFFPDFKDDDKTLLLLNDTPCTPCTLLEDNLHHLQRKQHFTLHTVALPEGKNRTFEKALLQHYPLSSLPILLLITHGKTVSFFEGALPIEMLDEIVKGEM